MVENTNMVWYIDWKEEGSFRIENCQCWHHCLLDLQSVFIRGTFILIFFFLFEAGRGTVDGRESFIHWFISQMPTTVGAGPDWSQEPATQSETSTWVTETQVLESSPAAFPGYTLAGRWNPKWSRDWNPLLHTMWVSQAEP